MLPAPSGLGGILMVNGSKGVGPLTCSLTNTRGLVLNGRNSSLLYLLAHSGTPIFQGNAFSFGVIMRALSPSYAGHSKAPRIMDLVHFLVLISMKHNFSVWACHVPGTSNEIADALSRFQVSWFRCQPEPLFHATLTRPYQ